ncbi:hypothetical protein ACHAPJ_009576 [Fusarium lateritium]
MAVLFSRGKHQKSNPSFFCRLPKEIRHMIYEELFGRRMIHIMYYNVADVNEMKRENRPRARIPGFANCVCRRPPDAESHRHRENDHKWCYVSANILRTCKQALEEGITTLYGSNTLMFHSHPDFVRFITTVHRYRTIIRKVYLYSGSSKELSHVDEIFDHLVRFPYTGSKINVRLQLELSYVSKSQFKKVMMVLIRDHESRSRLSQLINLTLLLPPDYIGLLQSGLRRAGYDHVSEKALKKIPDQGPVYGADSDDENYGYMLF